MEGRRKPGPKPKGDRAQITLRVPVKHRDLYALTAETVGMGLSDYLAMVLAQAHRLPAPADPGPSAQAQQAPVTSAPTAHVEGPLTQAS